MKETQLLIEAIETNNLWEKEIEISRNEYLKVKGSIDTNLYFIIKGSLRIYLIGEYEERTIRFGYQNNFIVSLDSFISEKPSDFYIQAIKKTNLKVITKKRFKDLINSNPEFQNVWTKILEQLILQQLEREKDILTSSPIERYKRVFKRSPQLFQEIPNKYIADYLRMTPETLSRIKKS
ncbi:Crp/Fnr family transcriptional regulator [Polaribacter vadi]|uniref:Crp/Fnr family transcriptional regulator n=1 Tax=Polaribacter TaxID=52959 RepID=UPI001C09746C|nr:MULTISPECIES: Crp/Fnr family transcriptional regulator [Polaribacter]MBU3012687.1 Crp/Fnr family transcriptional regulator [Polaribacter vadi]MDO6742504.1 Crp/Fnr family transcriptional regulator [Polaribacter sp. 1_MG-2023]